MNLQMLSSLISPTLPHLAAVFHLMTEQTVVHQVRQPQLQTSSVAHWYGLHNGKQFLVWFESLRPCKLVVGIIAIPVALHHAQAQYTFKVSMMVLASCRPCGTDVYPCLFYALLFHRLTRLSRLRGRFLWVEAPWWNVEETLCSNSMFVLIVNLREPSLSSYGAWNVGS